MDEDLEDLKRRTDTGSRIDEADSAEERRQLKEAIQGELEKIDAGERQKTVSVWDGPLAALIAALEERPADMERVGEQLQAELDVEVDEIDRSEVLRLALRAGFQGAAPDVMDTLRSAIQEQATKGL